MKKLCRIVSIALAALLLALSVGCAKDENVLDINRPDKKGAPAESTLCVSKIDGLSEDFLMGADISSLLSLEASGVKFYDWSGEVEQDIFITLAEAGINCVRVRVWNDPFDADGNGYGGGNCDINTALEIGKRAKQAGISLMVDFHYSDFWADPAKQMSPKAWEEMNSEERTEALYEFTRQSLELLKEAKVDVVAVQIGNETTSAMAGVKNSWTRVCKMFNAGSRAVREVYPKAKVVVHFTNPNRGDYAEKAASLDKNGVDYDVFASSYYPDYHGTIENMVTQLGDIAETYGKEVMVAETAWGYTMEDGDGFSNTFSAGADYPVSVQGQANVISAVIEGIASLGDSAIGVFYWEPAWVPVGNTSGLEGEAWQAAYDANKAAWEQYGSGWAASFAAAYDPKDAGKWYGGCSCENCALFDFDGKPLESLKTFAYVYTGTTAQPEITVIDDVILEVPKGEQFAAPETIPVLYSDMSKGEVSVEWDKEEIAAVNNELSGDYPVSGTAEGKQVKMTVRVRSFNLLANPGFEEGNTGWTILSDAAEKQADSETPLTGSGCFHFWDDAAKEVTLSQTVTISSDGVYRLAASLQGGEFGMCNQAYIFIKAGDETYTQTFAAPMTGWKVWDTAELTAELKAGDTVEVGAYVYFAAGGWGTMDDFDFGII